MHYKYNTLNGEYGFVVSYANGGINTELQHTWDEVPIHIPILALKLYDFKRDRSLFELSRYHQYFFCNVATSEWNTGLDSRIVSSQHANARLSAKIFGAISSHDVTEIYVDLTSGKPVPSVNKYAIADCRISDRARRLGYVGC